MGSPPNPNRKGFKSKRGYCPHCGGEVRLRASDGRCFGHVTGTGKKCPGSGELPQSVTP